MYRQGGEARDVLSTIWLAGKGRVTGSSGPGFSEGYEVLTSVAVSPGRGMDRVR